MKNKVYLHIGNNLIIDKKEVIGIFDLDKITVFKINRNYLSNAEKKGKIINVTKELPKSCILCCGKEISSERVYLNQFLTSTLRKRNSVNSFRL